MRCKEPVNNGAPRPLYTVCNMLLVARSNKVKSKSKQDDDGSEGLAELIPDIQKTAQIVDAAVGRLSDRSGESIDTWLYLSITRHDD